MADTYAQGRNISNFRHFWHNSAFFFWKVSLIFPDSDFFFAGKNVKSRNVQFFKVCLCLIIERTLPTVHIIRLPLARKGDSPVL